MKSGRMESSCEAPAATGQDGERVTAYQRIAATIAERIADGAYAPGSKLPPEPQFSAEFGVSLMTLRRALGLLTEQGLVYTEKGARDIHSADRPQRRGLQARSAGELLDRRVRRVPRARAIHDQGHPAHG